MKYKSAGDLRRAVENRLREQSRSSGVPLMRLRKVLAFERFLARLVEYVPDGWVLKGGLALEFRMGEMARATKDIDIDFQIALDETHQVLIQAGNLELGDWFEFEVSLPKEEDNIFRFSVKSLLDGRIFEEFPVDIGSGDPIIDQIQQLELRSKLEFAGIKSITIPCYSITQQISEKVHAYTRMYGSDTSSRVKDFVDILLIAETFEVDAKGLSDALEATFKSRRTHNLPDSLPEPTKAWLSQFSRYTRELKLGWASIDEAAMAASRFLDPIINGYASGTWNPNKWIWEE